MSRTGVARILTVAVGVLAIQLVVTAPAASAANANFCEAIKKFEDSLPHKFPPRDPRTDPKWAKLLANETARESRLVSGRVRDAGKVIVKYYLSLANAGSTKARVAIANKPGSRLTAASSLWRSYVEQQCIGPIPVPTSSST
jgi:hypothetical protein